MPLPAFRNPRSKVRRRRSHDALKRTSVSTCAKCAAPTLPHRVCSVCGAYGNRQVTKATEAMEKTLKKKVAKKKPTTAQE